jgi:predicted transcriptional regulator
MPKSKAEHRLIERLRNLAKRKDRSMNYLIVDAILQYLDRQEVEASS